MNAVGKTSALALLIFIIILVTYGTESTCINENQTTQNSSSPLAEVSTTVYAQMGTKALLCCPAISLTKTIFLVWTITLRGQPPCRISYKTETKEINETNCTDRNITWASTPAQSPDLQINTVDLGHDGLYLCEMSAHNGNFQKKHDLQVTVPPEVTLSRGENSTAVCEAIAGKPAAHIFWIPDGDCKTATEPHSNGTVTVRSTCHWENNNVSAVFCFVSHLTGDQSKSLELNQAKGVNSTLHSLLTILYVKLSILGIILLIIGFVFFQKRNYCRK
ncbi:cell surface glycoprotein CD200 receptor 1-like [Sigmodon hispidus]